MAEQILTVDVDWTSKSGSSDSTIAFGEQFTLNIKGMKTESLAQDKHSLRLMLLTQSVPDDDNVVWENGSSNFTVAEDGAVIVAGLKINTQAVLDALNQQGGKSRLYLAVTEMDDGAPFTDYGTSRLTVSLGSFIEDPSYDPPEKVDAPKFSDIKNLFDKVNADIDAIGAVETRVNAAKEAVEADKVTVATLAGQAQTAASTATSAANSAGLSVNSANTLATRAETAAQSARNAAAFTEEMQEMAETSASAASKSAANAKTSEDSAKGYAESAETAQREAEETTEANQSLTLSSSESAVQALESAIRAEEAAFGKTDESGNVVKDGAKQFAEQAEQAKTAIGDVGKRFDAVETEKTDKLSKYLQNLYEYRRFDDNAIFNQVNKAVNDIAQLCYFCHEGWVIANRYIMGEDYYLSPTGKMVKLPATIQRTYNNINFYFHLVAIDIFAKKTQIYATIDGKLICTTISGSEDSVACVQTELSVYPSDEFANYDKVIGYKTENGFIVCSGGLILDTDLKSASSFNCRAFVIADGNTFLFPPINTSDATTFTYFDSVDKRLNVMTIDDTGTPVITRGDRSYTAESIGNFYCAFKSVGKMVCLKHLMPYICNNNKIFYVSQEKQTTPSCCYGLFGDGLAVTQGDIFKLFPATNSRSSCAVQVSFGLFNNRKILLDGIPHYGVQCYEDASGNALILESYYNNTNDGFYHLLKKRV